MTNLSTRKDARRNRATILEVAEQAFAEAGIEMSLDTIARRAGVGPGTLYRHFPNREALIAAVLEGRGASLEQEKSLIENEETDTLAALERWLRAVTTWISAYTGLPDPLRTALIERTSPLAPACEDIIATTERFLNAAKRDGYARPEMRGRDMYLGTLAAAWATDAVSADGSVETGVLDMLRSGWATPYSGPVRAPRGL